MDLLAFPPVCLPLLGQSFGGLDGKVAGEVQPITYFTCLMDSWAGWGLTETNFTSDALKEVEVALFCAFIEFGHTVPPPRILFFLGSNL